MQTCADEIKESPGVTKARFVYRKSQAEIGRGGVEMSEASQQAYSYDAEHMKPPDIVSFLQNETNLTRRSIVEILRRSDRLGHFKRNPNKFIEQVSEIIKRQMQLFIVDGIKYHRVGEEFIVTELENAGFELDRKSDLLRNPDDDHSGPWSAVRPAGFHDRFSLVFRKPVGASD